MELLRSSIKYLSHLAFFSAFNIHGDSFAEGSYGKIYNTIDKKYVVKMFKYNPSLGSLIIELNSYAINIHPCILYPLAWTVKESIGYLVMEKGEDILEAYREKRITLEQIISDTLSAIAHMNSQGYSHSDIKPNNMIYHDGKCKIIDMGLCKKAILNKDGDYYINRTGYAINYRDPEYFPGQYNNIKVEIYALASSYKHILEGKIPHYGSLNTYTSGIVHIDWLLEQAKLPLSQRLSITNLLKKAPKELIVRRYETSLFQDVNFTSIYDENLAVAMRWISIKSCIFNINSRALFLGLHLMRQVYCYLNTDIIFLKLLACATLHLALVITTGTIISTHQWKNICKESYENYNSLFESTIIQILSILGGVIGTLTYWDYACGAEDLPLLLHDIINKDYNPNKIRLLEGDLNKNIPIMTMGNFLNKMDEKILLFPSIIYPAHLNVNDDAKIVEVYWESKSSYEEYDLIGVLMRNKSKIKLIKKEIALKICRKLYGSIFRHVVTLFFDEVCSFDWKSKMMEVLYTNTNPFLLLENIVK
jgi:serine/threonine protein kinase